MDWEPAEAPAAPPHAGGATSAPDARMAAADGGGAVAHTPSHGAEAARAASRRLSGSGSVGASVFLTPPAPPGLKSSLKRRAPASAPPAAAAEELPSSLKRSRGAALGARSVPCKSVHFRRTAITLGRAEASVDRTPHDMPNSCDVCGEYCLAGRWSCTRCAGSDAEYDMCTGCYSTASALSASLWPHPHGRPLFALLDAAPEEEDDEADSAARAAAEADGFFAAAGSPRRLEVDPAFAAHPAAGAGASEGAESPQRALLSITAAVDALQAPMSEHKLSV